MVMLLGLVVALWSHDYSLVSVYQSPPIHGEIDGNVFTNELVG